MGEFTGVDTCFLKRDLNAVLQSTSPLLVPRFVLAEFQGLGRKGSVSSEQSRLEQDLKDRQHEAPWLRAVCHRVRAMPAVVILP